MGKYIMALDAGTTSNRCILFDEAGNICSMAQKEFRQIFPKKRSVRQGTGCVDDQISVFTADYIGVAVAQRIPGKFLRELPDLGRIQNFFDHSQTSFFLYLSEPSGVLPEGKWLFAGGL